MSYYFSKILESTFEVAIEKVTSALQGEGFGVLTDIDVQQTLKKKIDVDFKNYRILGACNPSYAYKALTLEDKIGTMLPCNVVVQESAPGTVEIAAVDPVASMKGIENPALHEVAEKIRQKLKSVIEKL